MQLRVCRGDLDVVFTLQEYWQRPRFITNYAVIVARWLLELQSIHFYAVNQCVLIHGSLYMKNLVVDVFNKKNQYKENDQNQIKFDDPRWRTIVDVT